MRWWQLGLDYVHALVWPGVVVFVLWKYANEIRKLVRDELPKLLGRATKLSAPGVSLELEVQQLAIEALGLSAQGAVITAVPGSLRAPEIPAAGRPSSVLAPAEAAPDRDAEETRARPSVRVDLPESERADESTMNSREVFALLRRAGRVDAVPKTPEAAWAAVQEAGVTLGNVVGIKPRAVSNYGVGWLVKQATAMRPSLAEEFQEIALFADRLEATYELTKTQILEPGVAGTFAFSAFVLETAIHRIAAEVSSSESSH